MSKHILKKFLTAAVSTAMLATSFTVAGTTASVSAATDSNYAEALELSLYFFDGNMCGSGVTDGALTWRGDCHTYDSTASLSNAQGLSSSSLAAIKAANGGSDTVDVSGGYHDAGDHLKFSVTMGFAAASLGWSYYSYSDAYDSTGATDHLKYILKNMCDYFMKVTYLDSSNNVIAFCSMVGDDSDHNVWSAPETQTMTRPTYWADSSNPQASAAGEMSAALASSSLVFKNSDPTYAAELMTYANALQKFASQYCSDKNLGVGSYYSSGSCKDDAAWAELWCALGNNNGTLPSSYSPTYKITGNGCYNNSEYDCYMYTWDKVWSGYAALLAETGYSTSTYVQELKYELSNQGGLTTSKYNAAGWGASRYNCALQMLALHIADATNDTSYAEAAKYQMDYILGNNPLNMSFLVGYGSSWPVRIHHRAANPGNGNPQDNTSAKYTLYGALIGGPDSSGNYEDNQNSYQFTEPALDYNGSFALAIAGLCSRYGGDTTVAKSVLSSASEINSSFSFGSTTTTTTPEVTTTTTTTTTTAAQKVTTTTTTTQAAAVPATTTTSQQAVATTTESSGSSGNKVTADVTKNSDSQWIIDTTGAIAVEITLKGTSGASANGSVGYSNNGWQMNDWSGTFDSNGELTFTVELPKDVNSVQVDKYYAAYWDNSTSSMKEVSVELENATLIYDTTATTTTTTAAVTTATTTTTAVATTTAAATTTVGSANDDVVWGDADGNGLVEVNDAVRIMSYTNNSQKYPMDDDAIYRCDVNCHGDGISTMDALAVQKFCAQVLSSLPESYND